MNVLVMSGRAKPAFPCATHGVKALLAACALALSAGGVHAAGSVWSVARGTGHIYEWVAESLDWESARLQARARSFDGISGHLATITSAAEEAFLVQLANDGWLGGSDAETEGVWKWVEGPESGTVFWRGGVDGTALGYANWSTAVGNPNNQYGRENALHLYAGQWNDFDASSVRPGYFVEYEPPAVASVPEPSARAMLGLGLLALAAAGCRNRRQSRGLQGWRRRMVALLAACAAGWAPLAQAQSTDLTFDDNQLPSGWTLHSVLANDNYGFADGRFYAAEVDSSAYIESALTPDAASWSVSWDSALFQTVYGNFASVTLLDGSGHGFAVSAGSASYNFGEGLRLVINDGSGPHAQLLPMQAGDYRLSARFVDGLITFSGALRGANGEVPVFTESQAAPLLAAASLQTIRLQVYETLGPQVWMDNVHIAAVPEPSSAASLLLGLAPLLWWMRRRHRVLPG